MEQELSLHYYLLFQLVNDIEIVANMAMSIATDQISQIIENYHMLLAIVF